MKKDKVSLFAFQFITLMVFLFISCVGARETVEIVVNGHSFYVEIADTPEKRETGLMYRRKLPSDGGMLFVFPEEDKRSFWMKNTQLPLTICFIAKDGTIKEMYDMKPFSVNPVYSQYSVPYALEVNKGILKALGVKEGDMVVLPRNLPSPR